MRFAILLTALLGIIAFWAWFLVFKENPDNKTVHLLEGRAKSEIADACNRAASEAGCFFRFQLFSFYSSRKEHTRRVE